MLILAINSVLTLKGQLLKFRWHLDEIWNYSTQKPKTYSWGFLYKQISVLVGLKAMHSLKKEAFPWALLHIFRDLKWKTSLKLKLKGTQLCHFVATMVWISVIQGAAQIFCVQWHHSLRSEQLFTHPVITTQFHIMLYLLYLRSNFYKGVGRDLK